MTPPRPVVALMLESDGPGGAEIMLLNLGLGLRERGFEVFPVLPDNGPGWLARQFRDRGFEPETFTLRRPVDWGCVRGLREVFQRRGASLVHSHEFTMAVYGGVAAGINGLPHVITMHGNRNFARRWRRRAALGWAVRRSRAVAAVSGALAAALTEALRLKPGRVQVVPNGVELRPGDAAPVRSELRLGPEEPLILAVGNLYQVKGHMVLLQAAALLHRRRPELAWRVAIAGRGKEEAGLRQFVESQGLGGRVQLLGYRQDVPDLLAAASLWVMPSLSEGMPLALLEAMLGGKAIVASAVGAIPDVLADGKAGVLVPPGDAGALAAAMERLLLEPDRRKSLAAAAREQADPAYRLETMVGAYQKLYDLPVAAG